MTRQHDELATARERYNEAKAAVDEATDRRHSIGERHEVLIAEIQRVDSRLADSRRKADAAVEAWTSGTGNQSAATAARREVSELERQRAEIADLAIDLEARLTAVGADLKQQADQLGRIEKTLWCAISASEMEQALKVARLAIAKAYVAHLRGRISYGPLPPVVWVRNEFADAITITETDQADALASLRKDYVI